VCKEDREATPGKGSEEGRTETGNAARPRAIKAPEPPPAEKEPAWIERHPRLYEAGRKLLMLPESDETRHEKARQMRALLTAMPTAPKVAPTANTAPPKPDQALPPQNTPAGGADPTTEGRQPLEPHPQPREKKRPKRTDDPDFCKLGPRVQAAVLALDELEDQRVVLTTVGKPALAEQVSNVIKQAIKQPNVSVGVRTLFSAEKYRRGHPI
jgi:hypothetical protein